MILGLEAPVGQAVSAASEGVQIYRAVGEDEMAHVSSTGDYGSSPNLSGKYFALTEQGARNFAGASINAGDKMTITSVRIPRSVFDQGFQFHDPGAFGAGPSVYFQQDFLTNLYSSMTPITSH